MIACYYLTETELRRLHRRFGHPTADRFYRVLKRAGYDEINTTTIEKLTEFCHQCQMHSNAPGRFKFKLRDDLDFNHEVLVDVMYLEGKPVLHIIDVATSFQAARFLQAMTAKATWDALRYAWIDTYIGPPDTVTSDAGSNFTAAEFKANAHIMGIQIENVPVEAYNSIGKLERYHGPLRRAWEIIKVDMRGLGLSDENILQMAIKAVNDTAGPDGLVPTLLVFGTYPRLANSSPSSPSISIRAEAIRKAMKEIRHLKAKRLISDGLDTRNGPNTLETLNLPLQSEVKVWREPGRWTGPYILMARDGETCMVNINGRATSFRTTVVKPFHRDESTEDPAIDPDDDNDTPDPIPDDNRDAEWTPDRAHTRKKRGRPIGSKNKTKTTTTNIHLTAKELADQELSVRLRSEGKITAMGAPFEASDRQEIDGLMGRGVFSFEMFDPAKHSNIRIFKSRLIHEIKGKGTAIPFEKSRLVIQGHSDDGKETILTQSPTIQRASQRVILAIAPSLLRDGMDLWLRDITQAYT